MFGNVFDVILLLSSLLFGKWPLIYRIQLVVNVIIAEFSPLVGQKCLVNSAEYGFRYINTLTEELVTIKSSFSDRDIRTQVGTPHPIFKIPFSLLGCSRTHNSPMVIKTRKV